MILYNSHLLYEEENKLFVIFCFLILYLALTLVKGFGNYYGVDGGKRSLDDSTGIIYMCEKMEILKIFSREEIIQLALELPPYRMQSFLFNYPLLKEEKAIIMNLR